LASMVLAGGNRVRGDVLDPGLDQKVAPSLGGVVLGLEDRIYSDPEEFFSRTLLTDKLLGVVEDTASALEGRGRVLVLGSFFGGGKTHTLISIYHSVKSPEALLRARIPRGLEARVKHLVERLKTLKASLAVIDGKYESLSPSPAKPRDVGTIKVRTLWGFLAYSLGSIGSAAEFEDTRVLPGVDVLRGVLTGKRAVILVDEVAWYVKNLVESNDQTLSSYAGQVISFFEVLADAVDLAQGVALIISLPVEAGVEGVESVEKVYKDVEDYVRRLFRAVRRRASNIVEPIGIGDIHELLRTRLFEYIDEGSASTAVKRLREEYASNQEIFGKEAMAVASRALHTYPFHPSYVDTLLDILDKHPGLQKTRDLIRISRMVLRIISTDKRAYDFVMPWHIDPLDRDLGPVLLSGDYAGFKLPAEEDIKRAERYPKPWAAVTAAKALFARTFSYGGVPLPKTGVPTHEDLALMSYEPASFSAEALYPKDIVDAIKWLAQNTLYIVQDERTGRMWFVKYTTPIKYVEERARRVSDLDAVEWVRTYAEKLLREDTSAVLGRRKGSRRAQPKIFDMELSKVSDTCDRIDIDTNKYVLIACLSPLENDLTKLEETIYRTRSGAYRTNANTIHIVFPSSHDRIRAAVENTKKAIACDEVKEEKIVDQLVTGFEGEEARIAREVYSHKLQEYCDNAKNTALRAVLQVFDRVAYPAFKDGRNTVRVEGLAQADIVVEAVESTLNRIRPQRILLEMDFDVLRHLLKEVGVELEGSSSPRTVEEVMSYFYTNPKLPATTLEAVRSAVADGLRRLRIGLRCGNTLYYKKIERCDSESSCLSISTAVGEEIEASRINPECEVLPWGLALEEQMKGLKGGLRGNRAYEYFLVYSGSLLRVEDVVTNMASYSLESLRDAPLVLREFEATVRFTRDIIDIKARAGEPVSAEITLERLGPYRGLVKLSADRGHVEPSELKIGDDLPRAIVRWSWKAPEGGGEAVIEARDERTALLARARVRIYVEALREERGIVVGCVRGVPPPGSRVGALELEVGSLNLRPLEILSNRVKGQVSGYIELSHDSSSIRVEFKNIELRRALEIAKTIVIQYQNILDLSRLGFRMSVRITPAEERYIQAPEFTDREVETLRDFMSYCGA